MQGNYHAGNAAVPGWFVRRTGGTTSARSPPAERATRCWLLAAAGAPPRHLRFAQSQINKRNAAIAHKSEAVAAQRAAPPPPFARGAGKSLVLRSTRIADGALRHHPRSWLIAGRCLLAVSPSRDCRLAVSPLGGLGLARSHARAKGATHAARAQCADIR